MTPALKAMVEAMIAELNRQAEAGKPGPWIDAGPVHSSDTFEAVARDVGIDGRVDLEKVARAGLEAAIDQIGGSFEPEAGRLTDYQHGWNEARAMIGAILGEKP